MNGNRENRIPVILNPIAGGGRLLCEQEGLHAVAADRGSVLDSWIADSPTLTSELAERAAAYEIPVVLAY